MPRIDTRSGGPVTGTPPESARFYRQLCSRPGATDGADTRLPGSDGRNHAPNRPRSIDFQGA